MIAVDTNILARFIIRDDEPQFALAKDVLARPAVFVSLTVLLETAWLLERRYHISLADRLTALTAVRRMPNVSVEDADRFDRAVGWAQSGLDFADALHLAAAEGCEALVTFDRSFGSRATRFGASPPVVAP